MAKKKKSKGNLKLVVTLVIVVAVAVFMAMTKPSEADHSAVMQERFEDVAYSYLGASRDGLISFLVEPAVGKIMKSCFEVNDYVLVSVGRIVDPNHPDAEPTTVSIGLMNHVFAPSAERIRKIIDETDEAKAIKDIFQSLK